MQAPMWRRKAFHKYWRLYVKSNFTTEWSHHQVKCSLFIFRFVQYTWHLVKLERNKPKKCIHSLPSRRVKCKTWRSDTLLFASIENTWSVESLSCPNQFSLYLQRDDKSRPMYELLYLGPNEKNRNNRNGFFAFHKLLSMPTFAAEGNLSIIRKRMTFRTELTFTWVYDMMNCMGCTHSECTIPQQL